MHPVEAQSALYTKITAALRQARNEGSGKLGSKMLLEAANLLNSAEFTELSPRDQRELKEFYQTTFASVSGALKG